MRSFPLLLAALVLGVARADHHGHSSSEEDHGNQCVCSFDASGFAQERRKAWAPLFARTEAQGLRISKLAVQLDELINKLKEGKEKGSEWALKFKELDHRVHELEGTGCARQSFQCGGDFPKCVADVAVCDGEKDCPNGHDEHSEVCEVLTPAGATFEAHLDPHQDSCTQRRPHHIELFISSVRRLSYFQSRLKIKAHLVLHWHDKDAEQTDTFMVEGYYNFGQSMLAISPPEDDRLGIICFFDHVHNDRCQAYVMREITHEKCAQFVFHRKHDDH